jgi:hypothetical protein
MTKSISAAASCPEPNTQFSQHDVFPPSVGVAARHDPSAPVSAVEASPFEPSAAASLCPFASRFASLTAPSVSWSPPQPVTPSVPAREAITHQRRITKPGYPVRAFGREPMTTSSN